MDWVDLFCGSEGTLGVTLEAEVDLLPIPRELFAGVIFFASDDDALNAVARWRSVAELRMMEYADHKSLQLLRGRYPEIPPAAQAALLIEAEGERRRRLGSTPRREPRPHRSLMVRRRSERPRALSPLPPRHARSLSTKTMRRRGFLNMGTDYAVPLDRDREMLAFYRQRLEAELPNSYVIFGHIGDAHLHVNMLPASHAEADTATALLKEFAAHAVALGGTVSAEHGLGKRKASLLPLSSPKNTSKPCARSNAASIRSGCSPARCSSPEDAPGKLNLLHPLHIPHARHLAQVLRQLASGAARPPSRSRSRHTPCHRSSASYPPTGCSCRRRR